MRRLKMQRIAYQSVVVALACGFTAGCGQMSDSRASQIESNASNATHEESREVTERAPPRTAGGPFEEELGEPFRAPATLCGSNQECLDSPLVASTPRELAWLRANGYPSLRELRQLRAASSDALAADVARGSRTAMVILGARLVGQRRLGDGLELMRHAADAGSIYAYYELSSAQMHSRWLGGLIESAAYLRVAYLLGDVKAAGVMHRRFSMLDPMERALVDERAASLYRTYAKSRRPNPRPMDVE
jgi:hypothetical protein